MKRIILTLTLIIYSALIIFLSFQSGPDTADTSMRFTKFILHLFMQGDIPYETLMVNIPVRRNRMSGVTETVSPAHGNR